MLSESTVLAAVASPRRREILRLVWSDELMAGDIHRAMPDVTFGAVSQHLKALSAAGLVRCRPEETRRFYRADRQALGPLADVLEQMWERSLSRLKVLAELEQSRRGPRPRARRRKKA